MIQTEILENDLIRTYSDAGFFIHGGSPEGDYAEAIDPIAAGRTYTETNIPIPDEAADGTDEYFSEAGRILLGEEPEDGEEAGNE